MCRVDDADSVKILNIESPKARKEHRCYECGRLIGIGELYHKDTFVFEGEINTIKACKHCKYAVNLINEKCHGFVYGEIREELGEHFNTPWGYQAARFYVAMGRQWKRFFNSDLMKEITSHA